MANLQKVIKLTQAQYDTLAAGGTVGQYTGLNDNYIYLVKDTNTYATEDYVDAAIEDLTSIIPTNLENGATTGSLEQIHDGLSFTFVNPNSPLNNTSVSIGIATGTYATMLGGKGRVEGKRGFVNGTQVVATGAYSHAEGNNTHANAANSHAEGIQTYANGSASHAEGSSTAATETGAHSEGYGTHADGVYTHTEGSTNYALGDNSHAEGGSNIVGVYSGPSPTPTPGPAPEPGTAVHAEGMGSHAEGNNNTITGAYSHAEGQGNTVSSNRAHAEGNGNTVSGLYAHAEGNGGVASGEGAHSEGLYGHAIGNYSHAEGAATYANGLYSHAAGQDSTANGTASFASGYHVTANRDYQTVLGKYNLGQADTLLEVGKGTADNARSNAFEVHKDGYATVGAMGTTDLSVATKQYVDNNNTKNTAGSTNNNSKLFLVGALAQSTYAITYSRSNTFINANGVLVNTIGFSSYASAISSGNGLLNIGVNVLQYTSGSGPASFKVTSGTHGSVTIGETSGTSTGNPHNVYLQKIAGSAYTGAAYLLFPNVGTSSAPKTLATTDNFSASSSEVSGATEAKSIQINGTNWNLPSGGGAAVVSAEFVQAGYDVTIVITNSNSTSEWTSTIVYDDAQDTHEIGRFSSANGTLIVNVETGVIDITFDGGLVSVPSPTVTSGITVDYGDSGHYRFNIANSGTITFDGIDWDD